MLKRILTSLVAALTLCGTALGQYATLTGTLSSSNGMPAANYILSFTPSQFGFIGGTGVVINAASYCATSTDGSVVGVPNPLQAPPVTVGFSGTLPAANYYVKFGFYDAGGNLTLVSPETVIALGSTGRLIVAAPVSGMPAGATGMKVYISTSTNTETLQGQATGSAAFIQSVPLVSGASVPSSNTTICKQVANDAIWPTGTGYTVALTDPSGNTLPGYPMMWQLMGPNTTINLSNGLPYYHGTVYFPTPILASPLNHAQQSISGPLAFGGYNVLGVGMLGVGTTTPAWPIDVETGAINASGGYIFNGGSGVTTGQCLLADSDTFHTFRVPATCVTSVGTLYYQTLKTNGTPVTQQVAENYSNRFTLGAGSGQTNVDLNAPGTGTLVATYTGEPGASVNCATFDGNGNVEPSGQPCFNGSETLVDAYVTFTGCTITNPSNLNSCRTSIDFTTSTTPTIAAMPDTNYYPSCMVNTGSNYSAAININAPLTTTGFTYTWTEIMSNGGTTSTPTIYCHLHHN